MRHVVSRRFQTTVLVAALIGASLTTAGCKKLLQKKGTDANPDPATASSNAGGAAAVQGDEADNQLQEKLDEYIKCLNSVSSRIHESRHRYKHFIPKASGPTGKERDADLYKLSPDDAKNCKAGAEKAKGMPPDDKKVEEVGEEFAASIVAIDALMTEADKYFDAKDFRDDKWAKGKALHPRLIAAWDRFSKADTAMHATLDSITKPLARRMLAKIERIDGKKFYYHRKHTLIAARELVEAVDPVGDDDDVDLKAYTAAFDEYEKSLTELETYGTAHKKDLDGTPHGPNWPVADSNYDAFIKEAGDFKKSTKEFLRCLRDSPASAKAASGKIDLDKIPRCPESSLSANKTEQAVIKDYNEFITTSNRHQFP